MVCSHVNGAGAICRFKYHPLFCQRLFYSAMVLTTRFSIPNQQPDGAGVSKYIPPGIGIVLGLTAVFGALAGSCAVVAIIRTILVTACWHFTGAGFSGRQPGISSDNGTGEIQSRDGDPDFAVYYKEPSRTIPDPKLNLALLSTAKVRADLF